MGTDTIGGSTNPQCRMEFEDGAYKYAPGNNTGMKANVHKMYFYVNEELKQTMNSPSNTLTTFPGKFEDGVSLKLKGEISYSYDATTNKVPMSKLGRTLDRVNHPNSNIQNGSCSLAVTFVPYRKTFYGTHDNKSATINSATIRGLSGSSTNALQNGSEVSMTIPVGAQRVIFAYPADLTDLTSVKDTNGMNADIVGSFTKYVTPVASATGNSEQIMYKCYVLDFADDNDKENTFKFTI